MKSAFVILFIACAIIAGRGPARERSELRAASTADNGPTIETEQPSRTRGSLCAQDEKVIFSCAIKGQEQKMLSICSSKRLDERVGYVQYRFGRAGKVELEFPQERRNTQAAFRYTRYTRPLVTYLVLRFETNGYLYSVHQNNNEEEKPPVNEATVTVSPLKALKTNAEPFEFRCREPVKGTLMSLEDVVPRSDDDALEP